MAFPIDWSEQTDPAFLQRSTRMIEAQIRQELELVITQLRNNDMGDEEIFDVITENLGGSMTESQTQFLAQTLGIA